MCRRVVLVVVACLLATAAAAQKKDMATARDYVKKGNNLDKAEQMMQKLLADSVNRHNAKIWDILFDAQRKQYEQGNEKLYLKQKYDTASLFGIAIRMFVSMEAYDSIASAAKAGGYKMPDTRKSHAQLLNTIRPNLFGGGMYMIRHQKYGDGYRLLDQYINTAQQPLFASYNYLERDKRLPQAAYWAVYCAYKLGDSKKTLHHTYLALKDTAHEEQMLQYLSQTYYREQDTARYVSTLHDGLERYPLSPFFFTRLADFYSGKLKWNEVLRLTDTALKHDAKSHLYRLTKAAVLLNIGDYQHCLALCDSLLHESDTISEAWLDAGLAKFNQAVTMDKDAMESVRKRRQILKCYEEALPYLEHYRAIRPKDKERWGMPLYTIYLNLNRGKEFDEIDKLLKK